MESFELNVADEIIQELDAVIRDLRARGKLSGYRDRLIYVRERAEALRALIAKEARS